MTRYQKIARIKSAIDYNLDKRDSCNALYMGTMATAILWKKLGGDWPRETREAMFARATDAQLEDGLEYCANILKHVDRDAPANRTMAKARKMVRAIARGATINGTYGLPVGDSLEAFRSDLLLIVGEEE